MKTPTKPVLDVELRLREVAQLFNSMDPTPFHHKDLDPDAEQFIESWALEFPAGSEFRITLHLERVSQDDALGLVTEAIHNYFAYKAELTRRELHQLLRYGRTSLLIGLLFLAFCLFTADALKKSAGGTVSTLTRESLIIGGWVAMWRPMQIFFYDWWPIVSRRRIYLSLSRAQVRIVPSAAKPV
ncbi:MAG: hypothetical protein HY308_16860 [Gammaproteobacteria bacterium]|nr:hypothetical protein [Gammaproteobacteria bacterium]